MGTVSKQKTHEDPDADASQTGGERTNSTANLSHEKQPGGSAVIGNVRPTAGENLVASDRIMVVAWAIRQSAQSAEPEDKTSSDLCSRVRDVLMPRPQMCSAWIGRADSNMDMRAETRRLHHDVLCRASIPVRLLEAETLHQIQCAAGIDHRGELTHGG